MIQRIQTVYLLLALVFYGILFFVPLSMILPENLNQDVYKLNLFGINHYADSDLISTQETLPLLVLMGVCILLTVIIIFLFKNRPLQAKLGRLNMLLILIFVVLVFVYSDQMKNLTDGDINPVYLVGTYLPFIQIIMIFLAIRSIKKDEALVRSADRLR